VQELVRRLHGNPAILAACFYDGIIAFGDQQIVTGIAIMASAMKRMSDRDTPLSAYHLAIVGDLVWLCSNAHLLALSVIRSYDDSAKPGTPEDQLQGHARDPGCPDCDTGRYAAVGLSADGGCEYI